MHCVNEANKTIYKNYNERHDFTDNEDTEPKSSKLLKPGTKRRYDDILSVKSGKSSRSRASTATVGSKYKAGGKGIHR